LAGDCFFFVAFTLALRKSWAGRILDKTLLAVVVVCEFAFSGAEETSVAPSEVVAGVEDAANFGVPEISSISDELGVADEFSIDASETEELSPPVETDVEVSEVSNVPGETAVSEREEFGTDVAEGWTAPEELNDP
jgi:hypothetical protein